MQLLHEARVLLDSWNAKGLGLSTDSVDKVVVRDGCRANGTLNL